MAWKEGSVTYDGEFFKFDEVLTTPDTYQKPHPPVWFGCHSASASSTPHGTTSTFPRTSIPTR